LGFGASPVPYESDLPVQQPTDQPLVPDQRFETAFVVVGMDGTPELHRDVLKVQDSRHTRWRRHEAPR